MIKIFASLALAFSLVFTPAAAFAQDAGGKPEENPDAPHFKAEEVKAVSQEGLPAIDFDLTHDPENILYLDLSNGQRVAIRLEPQWAPDTVERVKTLARQGFYNGVIFHRVIDGFMAQTGDPTGTGEGGSPLPDLKAEFNSMPHIRGTLSMARAQDEDSANSQFFIVFYPRFGLDRKYTNFGRVISNMAAVDAIHRGEPPADPTYITQASLASDNKPPKFTGQPKLPAGMVAAAAPTASDGAALSQAEGQ